MFSLENMRKVCVVSGSRADYGLLYWLIKEIQEDVDLKLQLIVTGMHLSPEFGYTYKIIEQDGFRMDAKVEMLLSSDSPQGIAKSMGLATIGFAEVFERLEPDIVVLLGDRYEIFAAAQSALVARIPIAHLHGGERTEGAIDEAIRHSITKMASFHFVAAEEYRKRVIQLGEQPDRVLNFGSPALDNIQRLTLLGKKDFEESICFELGEKNFLVTYHSVTLERKGPCGVLKNLFEALNSFPDAKIIFTKSNSDTDGRIIHSMMDEYVSKNSKRAIVVDSLGQQRYLSAIQHVDVVIGNSSSGIIEAPAMKKPTVNVGDRQRGRLKATSIIDCEEAVPAIIGAIEKALSMEFCCLLPNTISLYGDGNASHRIKEFLKTVSLDNILMKEFFEIDWK